MERVNFQNSTSCLKLIYVNGMRHSPQDVDLIIKKIEEKTNLQFESHYNDATPSFISLFFGLLFGNLESSKKAVLDSLKNKVVDHLNKNLANRIGIVAHSQGGDIALEMLVAIRKYSHNFFRRIDIILIGSVRSLEKGGNQYKVHDFQHIKDYLSKVASSVYHNQTIRDTKKINSVCLDFFCHSADTYLQSDDVITKIIDNVINSNLSVCPVGSYEELNDIQDFHVCPVENEYSTEVCLASPSICLFHM